MFPNVKILGTDLYTVFLLIGVLAAFAVFRILADRLKLRARLQNLCLFTAVGAVIAGYLSAILFQSLYNISENGGLVIDTKQGATFYGGLIGGAAFFLLIYFVFGRFIVKDSIHIVHFFDIADIAACSISAAHAFGRIGCLMAGCCYGRATDAWYGIHLDFPGYKVIPTQLYEAIFLFCLLAYLCLRVVKRRTYCLQIYMIVYGVWRFLLEYMRDDKRGETIVSFLTPSQLIALLMITGAVALIFIQKKIAPRLTHKGEANEAE